MTRFAARRDANEPELVQLARRLGALPWHVGEPVDWLIGWRGSWIPTEVKNLDGRNQFTPQQLEFAAAAQARALPLWVWRTAEDVFRDLHARQTA